jgi:hypothetical protein
MDVVTFWATLVLSVGVLLALFVGMPLLVLHVWRTRVQRRGYPGLKAYLLEVPQTEQQKLDAIELTLKGSVICILAVIFPVLVVIGLVPLYYGARKMAAIALAVRAVDGTTPGESSM